MSEETKDPKADTKAPANQKPPGEKPPGDKSAEKTLPTKTFRNISTSPVELDFGSKSFRVNPHKTITLDSEQTSHHTFKAVENLLIEVQEIKETKTEAK